MSQDRVPAMLDQLQDRVPAMLDQLQVHQLYCVHYIHGVYCVPVSIMFPVSNNVHDVPRTGCRPCWTSSRCTSSTVFIISMVFTVSLCPLCFLCPTMSMMSPGPGAGHAGPAPGAPALLCSLYPWCLLCPCVHYVSCVQQCPSCPQDRVPAMLDQLQVHQLYFLPFKSALDNTHLSDHTKDHMLRRARELLVPISRALKKLKKFVEQDYFRSTRQVEGVHSLPSGLEYYQACLDWYLGVRVTPEQVFALGVREVARIEGNIKKILVEVGFHGNLKAFFQYVRFMPKFYNHTKEDLLIGYNMLLGETIQPRLSRMFYNFHIPTVTVVPVENDGPWGSYGQNVFYVNLKEPKKRSTFTMLPLALHETNPGHHFQESYTRRFTIPGYRADSMNGRLFSVPFHFPVYSAYAEGWALYAEYLGEEMGLFQDPYDLFGRYCSEIFRACRLVVDSGIHAFGWSRERAINFLSNYSDFPASQIAAEVDRYITWPGQACAYKVGEIKIKELRQRAEEQLGRRFDVKEFHHEVLKVGYVPLDILEEIVVEWIHTKKQRTRMTRAPPSSPPLPAPQSTARAARGGVGVWRLVWGCCVGCLLIAGR
ncbi:hypothetical protein ACOMHN_063800 [Nucella lapillus]